MQQISEELEVLIVCNPPNEPVAEELKTFGDRFKYFANKDRGANKARNRGITESKGRIIFFFDDDCEVPREDFLEEGVSYFDAHPEVQGIGGPYKPVSHLAEGAAQAYYFIQSLWLYEGAKDQESHRYLIGGNMALRRSLFDEFGKFDEALVFGGTETEFFRRINKVILNFHPQRYVLHDYQMSGQSLLRKAFLQGIGRSYADHMHGANHLSIIRWGKSALLAELGLENFSFTWVDRYQRAFGKGENFYLRTRNSTPGKWQVSWAVFAVRIGFFKIASWKTHLDRMICIIENFRRNNDPR
jgi:GT2 family glycosyltransferase